MHLSIKNRILNHIKLWGLSSTLFIIFRLIMEYIIGIVINLLLTFILLMIRPFVRLIILNISSERIGHLAFNTDYFLRKLQLDKADDYRKTVYIGMCQSTAANDQLLNMFSRIIPIISLPLNFYLLIKKSIKNNKFIFQDSASGTYCRFYEFNNTKVNLHFTNEEEERGKALLSEMGISEQDWFVCFHNRDSTYLKQKAKYLYGSAGEKRDWSYHDYRDSSIVSYIPAMKYIGSKGGYAIRMGSVVAEELTNNLSQNVIDYAKNFRSDFGDIYLSAKCKFFVGSNAGLSVVPYIFHKPMIMTNYTPMYVAFSPRLDNLAVPCKIYLTKEERYLSYREIFNTEINRWGSGHEFAKAGLEVHSSSEEEILDVTKEMYARVFENGYRYTDDDKKLRDQFKSLYPHTHSCHNSPISEMISIDFLRKNRDLIY